MILELLLISNATFVYVEKFIVIFHCSFTGLNNAAANHGLGRL